MVALVLSKVQATMAIKVSLGQASRQHAVRTRIEDSGQDGRW